MPQLPYLDLSIVVAYLAVVFAVGVWFSRRTVDSDEFMTAGRSLPGWAIGLSMFGSYVSSISFLANPGKAFGSDWNAFVFSIAAPIAGVIGAYWFVPFFRSSQSVSAYEHLEHRFGRWARTYATVCFLLTQLARTGTIIYLLALVVAPLTGWSIASTIALTAGLMTFCSFAGGMSAVIWLGVLQSMALVGGTLLCLFAVVGQTDGGVATVVEQGWEAGKFSLGSWSPDLTGPTVWVVLLFGMVTHLGNLGVDQSYVQRYLTASSDREASRGVHLTMALYVPVAAIFFFIGTALWVLYSQRPELLPSDIAADQVFPHFIATRLPPGGAGLVVAGIFAASMDSNLNAMATLTLCDLYKPYLRPEASDRESLLTLRFATLFWGVASAAVSYALIGAESALDAWWLLAGVFSGGVLGLFLLSILSRRATNFSAAAATVIGVLVILWMTFSTLVEAPSYLQNPLHANMTMVVGTLVIFLIGDWLGKRSDL
ncbi:sodium:solute symporter [Botrimarina mediterranea]|uniref:sodium:solute symporter n=1 Tax=Botrimarina mediterranea TaxID=2528022 RepID=UPI00118A6293|nr:Sodium/glucose cotransporter [Planctomycetes bacterium K2D]